MRQWLDNHWQFPVLGIEIYCFDNHGCNLCALASCSSVTGKNWSPCPQLVFGCVGKAGVANIRLRAVVEQSVR